MIYYKVFKYAFINECIVKANHKIYFKCILNAFVVNELVFFLLFSIIVYIVNFVDDDDDCFLKENRFFV